MRAHITRYAWPLFVVLMLTGCASTNDEVNWRVESCCPSVTASTFTLETGQVPPFLETILRANVYAAMAGEGFQPVGESADLRVVLRYEQDNLATLARQRGQDERVSEAGDVRYVAPIVVEMYDNDGLMFEGSIDKFHDVSPGEYMHTGNASVEIYEALVALLDILR